MLRVSLCRGFARFFDQLIEPRVCAACGGFAPHAGVLCTPCRQLLVPARLACRHCDNDSCARCRRRIAPLSSLRALFEYRGTAGSLIRRAKFGGDRAALGVLTRAMRRAHLRAPTRRRRLRADLAVVAVPLSRRKRRARGFNQSLLLAEALGERLHAPLVRALRRTRDTQAQGQQATLDARRRNVAGAFVQTRAARRLRGRRVLLVDDVVTSGATLRECARVLRRAGAREVLGVVLARARTS